MIIKTILLGIFQGFTEFFPVSSSGHLVIAKELFSVDSPGISLEIMLHFGTLLAVLLYFRKDLMQLLRSLLAVFSPQPKSEQVRTDLKIISMVLLASIPAGIAGVLFSDIIKSLFSSPLTVYLMLVLTGLYIFLSKINTKSEKTLAEITYITALLIGISQMLSVTPGLSRSGLTITTALLLGMKHQDAARFSFLLMIPAVAGAVVLDLKDSGLVLSPSQMLFAVSSSFLAGLFALSFLMHIIKKYRLYIFSPYCIIVGLTGIITILIR